MKCIFIIISYCRKNVKLHVEVPDLMEALMQYGDKCKAPIDNDVLELPVTKLMEFYMSDEISLAKSLMAISQKDMMQQPKVSYWLIRLSTCMLWDSVQQNHSSVVL